MHDTSLRPTLRSRPMLPPPGAVSRSVRPGDRGGRTLVRSPLADNLIDEMHLTVHPVALGTGIRPFQHRKHV